MAVNQGPYFGGARFLDLLGKNHGTLTNGPTWKGGGRPGGYGAINFDVSQYTDHPPVLASAGAHSVSAWVRNARGNGIVAVHGLGEMFLLWVISGVYQFRSGADGFSGVSSSTPASSVWQHVVGTYAGVAAGGLRKIYVNGVFEGSITNTSDIAAGSVFRIGAYTSSESAFYLGGDADDVRVYNRELSASEVAQLYAASRTGYRGELNWLSRGFAATAAAAPAGTGASIFSGGILNSGIIGIAA
jgi:hypothetical protein